MSDEEKEAKLELNRYIYGKNLSKDEIVDYLGIIFGLIEKQSKEIEELKAQNNKLEYTSNDKIKAKVEDILNSENGEAIEKLIEWQSLLEKRSKTNE